MVPLNFNFRLKIEILQSVSFYSCSRFVELLKARCRVAQHEDFVKKRKRKETPGNHRQQKHFADLFIVYLLRFK
uniref:Uncharacterized protein n=1 Tax=Oryza brachyantha TaxID=4533 RepID=J3KV92_ORYBR